MKHYWVILGERRSTEIYPKKKEYSVTAISELYDAFQRADQRSKMKTRSVPFSAETKEINGVVAQRYVYEVDDSQYVWTFDGWASLDAPGYQEVLEFAKRLSGLPPRPDKTK